MSRRAPVVVLPASAGREAWLKVRTLGLGGSDVAAACGLSPWTTPYQLWLEKTGRAERERDIAAVQRMRWGQLLEPLVLAEWDNRHPEYILTGGDGIYADPDLSWRLAFVDGLAWTPDRELAAVVEAKTGSHHGAAGWADDAVPVHYVTQVQWYLSILDAPRAYVPALLDTSTYVERVIERDNDLIASLIEQAGEFWRHVERDEPPPVDATDGTRRMLARVRAIEGETIELDPSWDKHITHREDLAEQIHRMDVERAEVDNRLREAMGTAELAMLGDRIVASHRAPSKPTRTCQFDRLNEDHPDLYPLYVTEKPASRRLVYRARKESRWETATPQPAQH
jgi:putative phage-type endonuclease